MTSILKYYSPDAPISGAYGEPVGYDCVPHSITVEYYNGDKFSYNYPYNLKSIKKDLVNKGKLRRISCDTGIIQEPSKDIWVLACANSRITKTDLVLQNGLGIIDPDYRGTIRFVYHTIVPDNNLDCLDILCKSCGQLVIIPRVSDVTLERVGDKSELSETDRGTKGFGSSSQNSDKIKAQTDN